MNIRKIGVKLKFAIELQDKQILGSCLSIAEKTTDYHILLMIVLNDNIASCDVYMQLIIICKISLVSRWFTHVVMRRMLLLY